MILTDEILATTIKHLSVRRGNFYSNLSRYDEGTPEYEHAKAEYEDLKAAVDFFVDAQAARVAAAS